jgi:hypothetical protein
MTLCAFTLAALALAAPPVADDAALHPYPRGFARGFHLGYAKGFRAGQTGPARPPSNEGEKREAAAVAEGERRIDSAMGTMAEQYDQLKAKLARVAPQVAGQLPEGEAVATEVVQKARGAGDEGTFASTP